MIIRTKRVKSEDGEAKVQTVSDEKPGYKLKRKVVESVRTKIKPGVSKAVHESANDLKSLIIKS
jgi:hypothetical protein